MHWGFNRGQGKRLQPRLTVSTNDAVIEAALRGFGITRVLSYQVTELLTDGQLETVLDDYEPKPWPIHLLHREDRYTSTRTRSFIDFIGQRFHAEQSLKG